MAQSIAFEIYETTDFLLTTQIVGGRDGCGESESFLFCFCKTCLWRRTIIFYFQIVKQRKSSVVTFHGVCVVSVV